METMGEGGGCGGQVAEFREKTKIAFLKPSH